MMKLFRKQAYYGAAVVLALLLAGCPNHYQKGLTYLEQGQAELAMQELLAALQKEPNNPDIYYQLGLLYLKQEAYRKAIEMFQQIADRFPAYAQRDGALVPVAARLAPPGASTRSGVPLRASYDMLPLVTERTVTINTTASGGNASLLSLEEDEPA